MDPRWPLDVTALGPAACGVRLWRSAAGRHLTVIVKAQLELVHNARASLITSPALVASDVHYQQSPVRSVERAAELAPYLAKCDVTLRGHAFAPPGRQVPAMTVRLAVYRGSAPVLDKKLFVFGDADVRAPERRATFQWMPLDYEHAYGGRGHAANPVGRGADAQGAAMILPNVVDTIDAKRTAGFAPLSRFWGDRTRMLGKALRDVVDAEEAQIGEGFDWRYFQSAPLDQQVAYLGGDEWIVMDGMHPALPRVQTQLPSMRGLAVLHAYGGGAFGPRHPIELHADTLAIDADRMIASVIWRGSMLLEPGVDVQRLKVIGGVELRGAPIAWPDPRSFELPPRSTRFTQTEPPQSVTRSATRMRDAGRTHALSLQDLERASHAAAVPFVAPTLPMPDRGVLRFPVAPPAALKNNLRATVSLSFTDHTKAADAKAVPFGAPGAQPYVPSIEPSPPPSRKANAMATVMLSVEALERTDPPIMPFVSAAPQRVERSAPAEVGVIESKLFRSLPEQTPLSHAPNAPPKEAENARSLPRRVSPQVPIVNATPLVAATSAWQVKPPQDSITVLVKATCDLVPGGPAKLRDETDPLSGDVFVDDDLEKSLVYASDFAVMKPLADVVLTGHACAPRGSATRARVSLKFGGGSGPRGFERSILVSGDRTWKRSILGVTPGDPAPFERIPLVHERAFGGPGCAQNPTGTGPSGSPLPNLEDPERPITGPNDAPPPACFAPISPLWRERSAKLGTYGAEWLSTRWPYFPRDFDWSHFQAAPKAQQVEHLQGDESFEITGMHPEHPVIRGSLPGLRVRAFALKSEESGSSFFEILLRLDTVAFDVDAMKVNLVWRGLFEASDDEAPEIETLFVHAEDLAKIPASLDEARRLLLEAATPSAPDEEEPPRDLDLPPPAPPPDVRDAVVARLASGESFTGVDLAGASLAGLDFSGRSLASANLKDASLRGCRFSGADLSGAILAGADLTECDLAGARLTGADLVGATLSGAVLDGADFGSADLSNVKADRASFKKARGESTQFAGGSFRGARFDGAELVSADFTEAKLDAACFEDAVLREVRFYYAKGEAVRFDRAKLDEARCDDAVFTKGSFANVSAPSSVWEKATLSGSNFASANLAGASFARALCEGAIFLAVDAPEARFMRAKLPNAHFLKANLMQADFERADLSGADLRGANLHGAETWKANVAGTKLDFAVVTRSKLKGRSH